MAIAPVDRFIKKTYQGQFSKQNAIMLTRLFKTLTQNALTLTENALTLTHFGVFRKQNALTLTENALTLTHFGIFRKQVEQSTVNSQPSTVNRL
ncbi:hypothetical protein NIES2100_06640 [Calothrix sp. NIES-2100]|uniref:hypothetical protein n=1 Tax=Calothrix sp. NIES-2100 TaxID=1954172 RepID=UPI000B5FF51B|nr:hypothetical protein NIES2100_06640 [Calothrix sp. NIES-2100]